MANENTGNKDKEKKTSKSVNAVKGKKVAKSSKTAKIKSEVKEEKTTVKKTAKKKSSPVVNKAVKVPASKELKEKKKKKEPAAKELRVEGETKEAKKAKEAKQPKEVKEQKAQKAIKESKPEKAEVKKEAAPKKTVSKYFPRLKKFYDSEVMNALKALYKYSTPMAVPKVVKVIINMGVGEATQDKSMVDAAVDELTLIAAQRAVKTFAKKSISNFHLREGMPIGARVTLRGPRMFDFIDKLISVALPRVRDFKGLSSSSFDGRGNYTLGLREQLVFPEINYDKITKIRGMDVTIVTTAPNDDEAYQLLKTLGFPFKEK